MKHERMTQVKICGLTNLEDALLAVEAGADLLGFIFYDASPRYVAPEVVRQIIQEIRDGRLDNAQDASHLKTKPPWGTPHASLQFVGVFVNASPETIAHTLDFCGLDAAQLHGDEPPEYLAHLAGRAYKALRPSSPQEAETLLQKYLPYPPTPLPSYSLLPAPYFLLDTYHPTLYGGVGRVADWSLAAAIAPRYPILLAGGLTPENVAEAIRTVQPWGVDVSSGVEAAKGKKDPAKVRDFVAAIRRAGGMPG